MNKSSQIYGMSLATVLPTSRHKWTHSASGLENGFE